MTADLTAFIRARLDEWEAVARAASPGGWSYPGIETVAGGTLYDETRRIADLVYEHPEDHDGTIVRHLPAAEADANGGHIAMNDPATTLARVAALRAVVELHGGSRYCEMCGDGQYEQPCPTLRALASMWADAEDYEPGWAL